MYCNTCKKEISADARFCPDCSTPLSEMSCIQFVNNCIKHNTTFLTAQDFIQGAKPLKTRWIVSAISAGITAIIMGLVNQSHDILTTVLGITVGALIVGICVFVFSSFVYGVKVTKMERKMYQMPDNWTLQEESLQDLGLFLRENLSSLPLAKWECGNPAILGIRVSSSLVLQCVFKNQTIHRISFPDKDKNSYCIKVFPTTKRRWMRGGDHWGIVSFLRYKNAKIFHPILEAAIDYYIREKLSVPSVQTVQEDLTKTDSD